MMNTMLGRAACARARRGTAATLAAPATPAARTSRRDGRWFLVTLPSLVAGMGDGARRRGSVNEYGTARSSNARHASRETPAAASDRMCSIRGWHVVLAPRRTASVLLQQITGSRAFYCDARNPW